MAARKTKELSGRDHVIAETAETHIFSDCTVVLLAGRDHVIAETAETLASYLTDIPDTCNLLCDRVAS